MTIRDRRDIKRLYYFSNYTPSSIARLYGLSHVRILRIIYEDQSTTFNTGTECALCSNDDSQTFHIDGNEDNEKPQNKIMLCEPDRRRIIHLQARRKPILLRSQPNQL